MRHSSRLVTPVVAIAMLWAALPARAEPGNRDFPLPMYTERPHRNEVYLEPGQGWRIARAAWIPLWETETWRLLATADRALTFAPGGARVGVAAEAYLGEGALIGVRSQVRSGGPAVLVVATYFPLEGIELTVQWDVRRGSFLPAVRYWW